MDDKDLEAELEALGTLVMKALVGVHTLSGIEAARARGEDMQSPEVIARLGRQGLERALLTLRQHARSAPGSRSIAALLPRAEQLVQKAGGDPQSAATGHDSFDELLRRIGGKGGQA